MSRPLGPRPPGPGKSERRSDAFENIFGRPSASHHTSGYVYPHHYQQQAYYPQQQQHGYYPQQQQGYYPQAAYAATPQEDGYAERTSSMGRRPSIAPSIRSTYSTASYSSPNLSGGGAPSVYRASYYPSSQTVYEHPPPMPALQSGPTPAQLYQQQYSSGLPPPSSQPPLPPPPSTTPLPPGAGIPAHSHSDYFPPTAAPPPPQQVHPQGPRQPPASNGSYISLPAIESSGLGVDFDGFGGSPPRQRRPSAASAVDAASAIEEPGLPDRAASTATAPLAYGYDPRQAPCPTSGSQSLYDRRRSQESLPPMGGAGAPPLPPISISATPVRSSSASLHTITPTTSPTTATGAPFPRRSSDSLRSQSFSSTTTSRPNMRGYHPSPFTPARPPSSALVTASRRTPLVYPALLSRVAEAFKARITLGERVKDGLTYTDAFDGREAVDKIAYIIKTTDRNLALLLGRALDAQKFFHDVQWEHRLRDSEREIYRFRERMPSPFVSADEEALTGASTNTNPTPSASAILAASASSTTTTPSRSSSRGAGWDLPPYESVASPSPAEDDPLPTGVFTLLTDCYSPTCTRERLCYSIACPRRLEQQSRLNIKPQPGLASGLGLGIGTSAGDSAEEESADMSDLREPGTLWVQSVPQEIVDSVSETELKRQEAINEVCYTERDFVRDLEYLRDSWIKPLRTGSYIPEERREDFVQQVFWNVLEIHAVNVRLCDALSKRQKAFAVVERIGDILLDHVGNFGPFVKYGAHQLFGKYEFEKEKGSNPEFAKFVEETERKPESRKLELNGYLTKPTTRLARYPLLLEVVLKHTPEDHPDKHTLPKAIEKVREFLRHVNEETGKTENRFNLLQLEQQLQFKPGEEWINLRLQDEQRELVFKGSLKKRGGPQSESAELQVFLFDHALLMVKAKMVNKHEQYKVYRKPIPLELLTVSSSDDAFSKRPKSLMSRTSTGGKTSASSTANGSGGGSSTSDARDAPPKPESKLGYSLTFHHLGRRGYSITLWASTFVSRRKWLENIEKRQQILRDKCTVFDTEVLSDAFFVGLDRANCAVPFDHGRRIVYGTDNGVYLSDMREIGRPPQKVIAMPGVTQIEVLEEYLILIVLAERSVWTFSLDTLDPSDPAGAIRNGRKISSHTSFFKAGTCLGRTLVCVVKASSLSSTIKTLEPIDQNARGKKQPAFRKLLQGGKESLRVFKEFYIPTESSSIHFLKSKLCVGCTKGFEIVDLETLDTQGLLDPADPNLEFVSKRENVKPMAIYRVEGDFLLCYDDFAFYVNKNGWRARTNWIVYWEGQPTGFALHYPYVLAFESNFVEVRHVDDGELVQVIPGNGISLLFADTPPSASNAPAHPAHAHHYYGAPLHPVGAPGYPPYHYPGYGPPAPRGYQHHALPPPPPPMQQRHYPPPRNQTILADEGRVLALKPRPPSAALR